MKTQNSFTMTVLGNYLPEVSNLMRGPLTRKLLDTKRLVESERSRPLVLVMPATATGIGALAIRCAKSVGISVITETDMGPERRAAIDLVIKVKLNVKGVGEALVEQLQEEYDTACDPWAENNKDYELVLPVTPSVLSRQSDLNKPQLPPMGTSRSLDNSPFEKIHEWREGITQEIEPTFRRDDIPAHGPGIDPDTNMAGGLQQS